MRFSTNSELQSRTMLFALLAGVVAGVVVGLAIAPKSGSKLRADIGDRVDDYMDSTGQKAEELRKSAASLARRGLKELWKTKANAEDQVKETVTAAVDTVGSAVESMKQS